MNLWTHFWNDVYTLSPSDCINVFVALGTLAMAVYTRKAVRDSRASIEIATRSAQASELSAESMQDYIQAAVRSAEAAELNAERMKDALMPYLDLEIGNRQSVPANGFAELLITNSGTGPARVGLFSHRDDLRYENSWDPLTVEKGDRYFNSRFADTVIASGETITFVLGGSANTYNERNISSLSVFYEDVYRRKYRARLLYTVETTGEQQRQYNQLGKELMSLDSEEYPRPGNDTETHALEGGKPALYNPSWESLHRLEKLEQVRNTGLSGLPYSNENSMRIIDVLFEISDYPGFKLQVDGFNQFVLESLREEGLTKALKYRIRDGKNIRPDYSQLGLKPSGHTDRDLATLYHHILTNGLGLQAEVAQSLMR